MGSHYRGSKTEIRALDAYVKLIRAAESVSGRVEAHFGGLGVSVSQFGVLETLLHRGPLYQKDLARKILKSTGNMTMVIDNLEERGLVRRVREERDRRHYCVELTDRGRGLISSYFPAHVERIVRELGVLTKREQETLAALCKRVGLQQNRKEAKRSGIDPASRDAGTDKRAVRRKRKGANDYVEKTAGNKG